MENEPTAYFPKSVRNKVNAKKATGKKTGEKTVKK